MGTEAGYSTLATMTAREKLQLFLVRPKLHMMAHVMYLGLGLALFSKPST